MIRCGMGTFGNDDGANRCYRRSGPVEGDGHEPHDDTWTVAGTRLHVDVRSAEPLMVDYDHVMVIHARSDPRRRTPSRRIEPRRVS